MHKTEIDKAPQEVMKNPKRQKRDKKTHRTCMKMLKEHILEYNHLSTSFFLQISLHLLLLLQILLYLLFLSLQVIPPLDPVITISMMSLQFLC